MLGVKCSGLLLALSGVSADFESLTKLAKAMMQPGGPLRQLPGATSGDFESYFRPYGCWCYFGNDRKGLNYGRGDPIDVWDALCKQLQEGYECAVIDAETRGETCEPWNTSYDTDDTEARKSAYKLETGKDTMFGTSDPKWKEHGLTDALWMCEEGKDVGTEQCQIQTCIAEYFYVQSVWMLVYESGISYHQGPANMALVEEFQTANSYLDDGFDRETVCPPKGHGFAHADKVDKACCGFWPRRFAYKTETFEGNPRGCCQDPAQSRDFMGVFHSVGTGKVFDTTVHSCCADGSIGAFGQTC